MTPDIREQATNLFDEICYSKIEGQVNAAIEKIRQLVPTMSDYLEREIIPILSLFTEAFRGDALTLGYHSTSVAESANRMVKRYLPSHIENLVEIRKGYTHAYAVRALGVKHRMERRFPRHYFLRDISNAPVSRVICELIDDRMRDSVACSITRSSDGPADFEVTDSKEGRWRITTQDAIPRCECNDTSGTGLPCSHLIALYHQHAAKTFPLALIAPRWIPVSEELQIPELPDLSLEECDEVERIASEESGDEEEEEAIQTRMSHEGHNLNHQDVEEGN
jgi:hypothetical protein